MDDILRLVIADAHQHHQHHVVRGIGYTGVLLAALVGWVGVPGTGEVGLVAGAVLASRGKLDVVPVLAAGWAGAVAGGVAGWWIGLKGGRRLVVGRGPGRRARGRALAAGERLYASHPLLAVYFAPAWMAGVNRMPPARYLSANVVAASIWTAVVGLGGFFAGRPVLDLVNDAGIVGLLVLAAIVVSGVIANRIRAWRRRHPV